MTIARWLSIPVLAISASFILGAARASASDEPLAPEPKNDGAAQAVPKLTASCDVTFASKYLFQGFDYSDGRSVLQPEVVLGLGALSATVWANHQPDLGDFNEVDVTIKYATHWRKLSIAPGYLNLSYPNRIGWSPSQEITLDLGLTAPLSPTLSLHYDFDAGTGIYSTLGLTQPVWNPLTLGMNLYYQNGYYDMTGVPSMELKASAALAAGGVTVTPAISRFVTWEKGRFEGGSTLPSTWLFAINVSRAITR
jgi:hypothetical protein